MKAMTYIERGRFALTEKPKPDPLDERDAIVMVTLGSPCRICTAKTSPSKPAA